MSNTNITGPHLLVPVAVEALIVNNDGNDVKYADITPQYSNLDDYVLGNYLAQDYFKTAPKLAPGIHIHWALPDALTQGAQNNTTGATDYPAVPNRWLVVRICTDITTTIAPTTDIKSWIVESDYLSTGITAFNEDSRTVPALNSDPRYRYLGQKGEYGTDNLPSDAYLDILTAIGPGDPMFSAYYPNCRNVFGLYDSLEDVNLEHGPITISYLVAGWYDNPEQDPLFACTTPEAWAACLDALKWSVPEGSSVYPTQTLCHGMVYNLSWNGPEITYPVGIPTGLPDIAVGNTSIEALSALIASKNPKVEGLERLLLAFMYDQLSLQNSPDGNIEVEETIHQKTFSVKAGGNLWIIRRTTDTHATEPTHSQLELFPEDTGLRLDELNKGQEAYDKLQREIISLKWELYSTWYKYIEESYPPDPNEKEIESLRKETEKQIGQINQLKDKSDAENADLLQKSNSLAAQVKSLMPGYELTQEGGQRFWQANNPVILFSGDGVERSLRHGADTRFTHDDTLLCRTSGQVINGLALPASGKQVLVTAQDIPVPAIPNGRLIPPEITSLLNETFLLDVSQSVPIAVATYKKAGMEVTPQNVESLKDIIEKMQNSPWNAVLYHEYNVSAQELAEAVGFQGTLPSKVAVNPWKAPWVPLFMEWSVIFSSDNNILKNASPFAHWCLDNADYQYQCAEDEDELSSKSCQYDGFITITPHVSQNMRDVLTKYIENLSPDDPNYKTLSNIVVDLGYLNILSQNLSGFNDDLIMRKQTLQLPVFDLPGGNPELAEEVAKIVESLDDVSPREKSQFNPLRAGFASVRVLWIVDTFGQIKILEENPSLVLSENVTTPCKINKITLPPRIVQPGRLVFKWVSATTDLVDTNSDPATHPICGWVIPNHLNNSLMIYKDDGTMLGSLQLIKNAEGITKTVWWDMPGTSAGTGAPPQNMNAQLKGFIDQFFEYDKQGIPTLEPLLSNINEILQTVNPAGGNENKSLSVLIGRPLALVRASVKLEIDGYPAYNQDPVKLGEYDTGGLENVPFPVRLGDIRKNSDGLVGFFIGNTPDTYKTIHITNGSQLRETTSPYIDFNDKITLCCAPDGASTLLTLLVDPRAGVHLISGIQPVKYAELPKAIVSEALKNMVVSILVNPVIYNDDTKNIPLPPASKGKWSWVYRVDTDTWNEEADLKNATAKAPLFPGKQQLNEGWLILKNVLETLNSLPPKTNHNMKNNK